WAGPEVGRIAKGGVGGGTKVQGSAPRLPARRQRRYPEVDTTPRTRPVRGEIHRQPIPAHVWVGLAVRGIEFRDRGCRPEGPIGLEGARIDVPVAHAFGPAEAGEVEGGGPGRGVLEDAGVRVGVGTIDPRAEVNGLVPTEVILWVRPVRGIEVEPPVAAGPVAGEV